MAVVLRRVVVAFCAFLVSSPFSDVAGPALSAAPAATPVALPADVPEEIVDALLAQFDNVVFGAEHGERAKIIRRWHEAPQVAIFADPSFKGKPAFDAIRSHLDVIRGVTGLDIHRVTDPAAATLRLGYFPRDAFRQIPKSDGADEAQYERFVTGSACLGLAAEDKPGNLRQGAIMIGTDIDAALQTHCLLEELVQIMGLPNDACQYRPSLFCEDDMVEAMTPADRVLLKTLYDPRLVAGMTRDAALPIAREIIRELALEL